MATKTTNYNLIKPDYEDSADIQIINGNMDVLDTQLKSISDKADTGSKNAYTDVSVSNDYTWKFTKGSGSNVSYDKIKKSTVTDGLTHTTDYKPNTDSTKYSQLQYHFGTIPKQGSSTVTIDGGTLKFNHGGASPWNTALSVPNNPSYRPYVSYQKGVSGTDYSEYAELAYYSDVTGKLDKTGGNLTGALYTTDNIYKSSNNDVLVLSGSTDVTHGARINLSGEKQTDAGLVKITADNGTVSNTMQIHPINGRYTFNDTTMHFNTGSDVFFIGNDNQPRLALNKNGVLQVSQANSTDYAKVLTRNLYTGDWDGSWAYQWNDLLIQGGRFQGGDTMSNITLPRPYTSKEGYILYVSDNNMDNGLSDYAVSGKKVSNTTIAVQYFTNRYVTWLTIGGWGE